MTWDAFKLWADEHGNAVMLIIACVPALFWIKSKIYAPKHWEKLETHFQDPGNYPRLLERYKTKGAEWYFTAIRRPLFFANRVYGRDLRSWRAFNTSLTLAFFYPLIAFLLAWLIGNVHTPGGLEMFRDIPDWFERLWRSGLLIAGFGTAFFIALNAEKFSHYVVGKLFISVDDPSIRPGFRSKAGRMLVEFSAFAFALAVAGAFVGAFAFAVASANAFAIAIAISGTNVFAIAGAGEFAGSGVVAVAVAVAVDFEIAAVLIFFYLLLPFLNALADFGSVGFTRYFLHQVARKRPSIWMIFLGFSLDVVVAAACLILLIGSIIGALTFWQWLSPDTVPLDWRDYWAAIGVSKWNGVSLYLMIATTLVPTALHFAVGLGAFFTQKSRKLRRVASALEDKIASGEVFPTLEAEELTQQVRHATFWSYSAGVALLVGLIALAWWGLGVFF